MRRLSILFAVALASCEPKEPADTVLVNGKVVTLDAEGTIAEAVAIARRQDSRGGNDRGGPGVRRLGDGED